MRLASTKESVARGEVSILAIVETLLAIALVFYLSAHFNTLRWLAVAMCVSPLLLLRTEESVRLGIDIFDRMRYWPTRESMGFKDVLGWFDLLVVTMIVAQAMGFVVVMAPAVRFIATVVSFARHPLVALREIPKNWFRITFGVDTKVPPEVIPEHSTAQIGALWEGFPDNFPNRLVLMIPFIPIFLPAILYRFSLKATSIIYAPLVFVAHSTFSEGADLRTKLELIKRGDLSRIRVWYGVIAILAFAAKLVLMMNLPGFTDWWNEHPASRFLALYVAPAEIPKWQLAELANSALAIGAMLFARRALLGYDLQHPWPEVAVKRLLGLVSGLRWVLALYAILCTGYITMRAAQHWHWPALGEQWLPW